MPKESATKLRHYMQMLFPERFSRIFRFLLILIIVIIVLFTYYNALRQTFNNGFGGGFDDAYMFSRYAQNLLSGNGFSWNINEGPVYGPTSIPYVFVVAIVMSFIPIDSNFLLPLVSWCMGLLVLFLLEATSIFLSKKSSTTIVLLSLASIAWSVIIPFFNYHATTGMDTTFSMLTNTILIVAWIKIAKQTGAKRSLLLALCAYISFAARPDNIFYAFTFPILALITSDSLSRKKEVFLFLIFFSVLLFADMTIKINIFGDPFPLSYYIKQHGFYQGYLGKEKWNSLNYLSIFILVSLPSVIFILVGLHKQNIKQILTYLLPVLLTVSYYFTVMQIMGMGARYYYPSLPFVIVAGIHALTGTRSPFSGKWHIKMAWRLPGISIFLTGIFYLLGTANQHIYYTIPTKDQMALKPVISTPTGKRDIPELSWSNDVVILGQTLQFMPQGSVVAASEVGYIGAKAPQVKIIDMAGLNDPFIAHNGFKVSYVFSRKPDLIWFPHADYAQIRYDLICSPELHDQYHYYPELFDYGIAIRKDSQHTDKIMSLLRESMRIAYPGFQILLEQLEENSLPEFCQSGQ